ncbi:MAG: GNAT family N-acetyltransferase [Nocardioides sp.]|nr:GNAT family N-acetyltransferase [Nocardioides sp.]
MTSSRRSDLSHTAELGASTVDRLHLGWADEISVPPELLSEAGDHFVVREEIAMVMILDLFESQVVIGPSAPLNRLRPLAPEQRSTADDVRGALGSGVRAISAASLSYAEDVRAPLGIEVAVSPVQNVDLLRDQCSAQEWEESGLIDMPSRIAARRSDGKVAAVAGFERWGLHIAQLGVLVDPQYRGQGYGACAAARAAQVAQGDQLIPQWRCRMDNVASLELAQRLGFIDAGRQLVIALEEG